LSRQCARVLCTEHPLGVLESRVGGGEPFGCLSHQISRASASPASYTVKLATPQPQVGLGSAHVPFGLVERSDVWLGAVLGVVECAAGCGDRVVGGQRARNLAGEVAALGDGRDVGAVVGEDLFEDVTSLCRVIGNDEQAVLLSSPRGGHVQAGVARGCVDDGQADVDGVALVAVGGGGVAETDVGSGVVGGEGHLPVSVEV
jgi:hypothetical protein